MGRIKDYFQEQGLAASDLPLALVLHELISVCFAAAVWSACYKLQPAALVGGPLARALPAAARARTGAAYAAALGVAEQQVARQAWLRRLPAVRDAQPKRLVLSLAESLVVRGGLKPATFVGKLWLSYKGVLMLKHRRLTAV